MHKILQFLSLNICYVIYVLLWIKYWLMWFQSLLVFILFKFKKRPINSGCIYILVVGKDESRLIASKIKVFFFSHHVFFYIHLNHFFFSFFYSTCFILLYCGFGVVILLLFCILHIWTKFHLHLHHFDPQVVFFKHFETVKHSYSYYFFFFYSNKQNNKIIRKLLAKILMQY